MTIKVIFNKAHEEEIFRSEKAIICFSAEWCIPCKNFSPIYSNFSNEYDTINFYKVDIDDISDDLINMYNITSVPTFIFLKNGVKVNELVGTDERKFLSLIQEL